MTAVLPSGAADQLAVVGQLAVRDLPADWWCPNDATRQRVQCPECIAEIVAAALLPVVERLARDTAAAEIERHAGFLADLALERDDGALEDLLDAFWRDAEALRGEGR